MLLVPVLVLAGLSLPVGVGDDVTAADAEGVRDRLPVLLALRLEEDEAAAAGVPEDDTDTAAGRLGVGVLLALRVAVPLLVLLEVGALPPDPRA